MRKQLLAVTASLCILFSCSGTKTEKVESSDIVASPETELQDDPELDVFFLSEYLVPSDFDLLNAPPESVQTYRTEETVRDIIEEQGIDLEEAVLESLKEEAEKTKALIFSTVP